MKRLQILSAMWLLVLLTGCAPKVPADIEKALTEQYATIPLANEGRELQRRIRSNSQGNYLEVDVETAAAFRDPAFQKQMEGAGWRFTHANLETRKANYQKGPWGVTFTDLKMPKGQVRVQVYGLPAK